jgi:hypothetical protein
VSDPRAVSRRVLLVQALGVWAAWSAPGGSGWAQGPKGPDRASDKPADAEAPFEEAEGAPPEPPNVWGRVMVEEESPEGPWTPLSGVEVGLLPDPRPLMAELERIRQASRGSWRNYDQAVARLLAALEVRHAQAKDAGQRRFQQATDAWGVFRFSRVPPGEWLLVAILISPYRRSLDKPPPKAKPTKRGPGFLDDGAPPPKEAEVWLTQLTVEEGRSTRAVLSERARWMAGPVRQN